MKSVLWIPGKRFFPTLALSYDLIYFDDDAKVSNLLNAFFWLIYFSFPLLNQDFSEFPLLS